MKENIVVYLSGCMAARKEKNKERNENEMKWNSTPYSHLFNSIAAAAPVMKNKKKSIA